jgi:diacylglycerol diphosphate phosphatase/phosphatidate phosphatase
MDYRHHAGDVIAGSIIGIVSAWFAYRQFYPVSRIPTGEDYMR